MLTEKIFFQNRGLAFYYPPRLPPPRLAKDHTFFRFFWHPSPMDLPYACQVKTKILWIYLMDVSNLMVVHLMDVRSYACLVDGCLLTHCPAISEQL